MIIQSVAVIGSNEDFFIVEQSVFIQSTIGTTGRQTHDKKGFVGWQEDSHRR